MTKPSVSATEDSRTEADKKRQRKADLDTATQPASGASVAASFAGASLSAANDDSETEAELKKAAKDGGSDG